MSIKFLLLFIILFLGIKAQSQVIYLDSIVYTGNKKTKNYIIRRELDFKSGDSLLVSELQARFAQNKSRILNTGLFKDVLINIKTWDTNTQHVSVSIHVEEAWYIYPFPIFELADRNFNVWWDEFNGTLKRVNYGVKFYHSNLTGQADKLRITLHTGYSTKVDLDYLWPFWGKNRSWRFTSNILYTLNKESHYDTEGNKLIFYKSEGDNNYSLRRFSLTTALQHRTTLQLFQSIELRYQNNIISNVISEELNPDFFLSNKNNQNFLSLTYEFRYDDRDLKYYPSKGRQIEIEFKKEGIGKQNSINTLTSSISLQQFFPWNDKHNFGILAKARGSIIRNQAPYYNSRALGFAGNYLKGYEHFVIDGMDFFFLKARERFKFFDKNIKFLPRSKYGIKSKPIKLGVSIHSGIAYVNNIYYGTNNDFSNRWLYSAGLSLEGVISNTSFFQVDYSINHLKQTGIFIHFNDNF